MEFNPEIEKILKEFNIDSDAGHLVLLGIYHELNVVNVVPETIWKQINLTKIVELDFENQVLKWNVNLFTNSDDVNNSFGWIVDFVDMFGNVDMAKKGSYRDAVPRMKKWFSMYPEYRKEDVMLATEMYLRNIPGGPKYCMKSHKFIFDGAGAMKKSTLLEWVEKYKKAQSPEHARGRIIT